MTRYGEITSSDKPTPEIPGGGTWRFPELDMNDPPVGVTQTSIQPLSFHLSQNYPNPFNPETTIRFDVKERTRVVLKVYDMMGREVLTLVDSEYDQGRHHITFNSSRVTSGLYFYRIRMGDFCDTKKMILLK